MPRKDDVVVTWVEFVVVVVRLIVQNDANCGVVVAVVEEQFEVLKK